MDGASTLFPTKLVENGAGDFASAVACLLEHRGLVGFVPGLTESWSRDVNKTDDAQSYLSYKTIINNSNDRWPY
jgi:hypothetical protein